MPLQNSILNNAKELDPATGWYYYGARYYAPQVSTWLSVDPLSEKYPAFSPYNFTMNNPVRLVDADGKEGEDWYEKLDEKGKGTGEIVWIEGNKDLTDKGYKHLGKDVVVTNTDENNNKTTIKYDGDTKSSYKYNSETATWDLEHDYKNDINYTAFDKWAKNNNIDLGKEAVEAFKDGALEGVGTNSAGNYLGGKKPTAKGNIIAALLGGFLNYSKQMYKRLQEWDKSLSPLELQHRKNLREIGKQIQIKYGKDPEE